MTDTTITVQVPFRVVKRGGRKEVHLPPGAPLHRRTDNTLLKALARAFRRKRVLESGEYTTIADLARHEGTAKSYMTRVLRLTLLASDIVEAILNGRQGPGGDFGAAAGAVSYGVGEAMRRPFWPMRTAQFCHKTIARGCPTHEETHRSVQR